jgi:quercetin dioxygenase-like cupin family protein
MNHPNKIIIGGLTINYFKDGSKDKSLGAFELTVAPGAKVPPPHSHSLNEEYVYVLEGKLRYSVNGEARDLSPGESMATPRGAVHAFSNPFAETAKALVILSPDVGAQYFREVSQVLTAGHPPDIQKIKEVMGKYGLVLPQ